MTHVQAITLILMTSKIVPELILGNNETGVEAVSSSKEHAIRQTARLTSFVLR